MVSGSAPIRTFVGLSPQLPTDEPTPPMPPHHREPHHSNNVPISPEITDARFFGCLPERVKWRGIHRLHTNKKVGGYDTARD